VKKSRRQRRTPALRIPKRYGGKDGSNLWMAVIREHFAPRDLACTNDLQNEHSIVGNLPLVTMPIVTAARPEAMIEGSITGKIPQSLLASRARAWLRRDLT